MGARNDAGFRSHSGMGGLTMFAHGIWHEIGPGVFFALFALVGVGPVLLTEWIRDRKGE